MIEFPNLSESVHHCTSHYDGEWIVWRCPYCQKYERRLNTKTNEMITRGKTTFQHVGSFMENNTSNIQSALAKNLNKINQN